MPIVEGAGRFSAPPAGTTRHWVEHLRTADLSVGTYSIPAGGVDDQTPHTEDEIYVVTAGRAVFTDAGGRVAVGPGDTVFVAAGAQHRFVEVSQDFAVVVVFAPAEGSRG
jgi:mannose-6-phosphate isomerase-like protein (cupin superfamily)